MRTFFSARMMLYALPFLHKLSIFRLLRKLAGTVTVLEKACHTNL
jgi:hypothetical protein